MLLQPSSQITRAIRTIRSASIQPPPGTSSSALDCLGSAKKADESRMRLAIEMRHGRQRVEAIVLGQPTVVSAMLSRLDDYESKGAKSAPLLREHRTRELLQGALSSMCEALAAHAAGASSAESVVARFEVEGVALSNHAALHTGRLINFSEMHRIRGELQLQDAPHRLAAKDLMPTAIREIQRQRLQSALLALAPLEERMFEANRGLVGWGLSRFRASSQHRQDLEAEGLAALYRCVQRFRPEDGNTFASYAGKVILMAIAEELRDIRPLGRHKKSGDSSHGGAVCVSLHQPLAGADSSELLTVVADPRSVNAHDQLSAIDDKLLARSLVRSALSQLQPLSRRALVAYFGVDSGVPVTLREVGEQLGVSASRVHSLVVSGKRQLAAVLGQSERARRCVEALELRQLHDGIAPQKPSEEIYEADDQSEIPMCPEPEQRSLARKKGAAVPPVIIPQASRARNSQREEAQVEPPATRPPTSAGTAQAEPAKLSMPVGFKVDVLASIKALARAVDELGAAPKLIDGEELLKRTEEYCQSLRSARIAGRSSEESSGVPTDRVRRSKELVESVHRTLYRVWPLGHIDETQGFRLEGEMLQMKKNPTGLHLVLALDATVKYLQSLPR